MNEGEGYTRKKKIRFGIAGGIILLVAMDCLYYQFQISVDYDDFPQYENFGGLNIH